METKNILAVITARANSQGLPGKNYKRLYGRPLVQWSILAAIKSEFINCLAVSSNCEHVKKATEDICNITGHKNLLYIDRPEEISTSTSKNEEALIHAVDIYQREKNIDIDIVVNLQPTSPIRTDNLLDKCIKTMLDNKSDSLLTVDRHTPFFWKKSQTENVPLYDINNRPMRDEILESDFLFHDNGNIYIMEKEVLLSKKCRIGDTPFLYETDKSQSLQIDTEEDFILISKVAESKGQLI